MNNHSACARSIRPPAWRVSLSCTNMGPPMLSPNPPRRSPQKPTLIADLDRAIRDPQGVGISSATHHRSPPEILTCKDFGSMLRPIGDTLALAHRNTAARPRSGRSLQCGAGRALEGAPSWASLGGHRPSGLLPHLVGSSSLRPQMDPRMPYSPSAPAPGVPFQGGLNVRLADFRRDSS